MSALLLAALLSASAPPSPPLRAELEPMRFLVGHCWRGERKGGTQHDVHCFEPVFDGQHVRDRHEVSVGSGSPTYCGETLYSWDGAAGRVAYVYWNSLGGVSRGTMVPAPGKLDFGSETYKDPDGREVAFSTHWRIVDERSYEAVTTSAANPTGDQIVRFTRID
ncbi:MAG TPA: hypothetical protein VK472_03365 [Allosphingosinicella sp.]|nr:hypothetical protein [Allosphingosinicella sp.]